MDQKLAALEEAVRAEPADARIRGQLADLYFAKGRFEDAIAQYTALIDAKKDVDLAGSRAGPTAIASASGGPSDHGLQQGHRDRQSRARWPTWTRASRPPTTVSA